MMPWSGTESASPPHCWQSGCRCDFGVAAVQLCNVDAFAEEPALAGAADHVYGGILLLALLGCHAMHASPLLFAPLSTHDEVQSLAAQLGNTTDFLSCLAKCCKLVTLP